MGFNGSNPMPDTLSPTSTGHTSRFINRELSWLAFNQRVLDEAFNPRHPLMERLNFLAISGANLDEFYMVRISSLRTQMDHALDVLSVDGLTPAEQLTLIINETQKMLTCQQDCWKELRFALADNGLTVTRPSDLSPADVDWLRRIFHDMVLPLLTPIAVDPAHPFPLIHNKGVALIVEMENPENGKTLFHLVPLPAKLERFVRLVVTPEDQAHTRCILLERMVLMFINELIPGFILKSSGVFRVIRDAELEFDERAEDLLRHFETALSKRRLGSIIRLGFHRDTPQHLRDFLCREMRVLERDTHVVNGMNGIVDLKELLKYSRPDLRYSIYEPRQPERVRDHQGDVLAAIRKKDLIIHHPYESFDVVVHFLRQAAADPDVLAIKQTLYRTSADSPVVQALIEAASAGKTVTAMIELKARFDEEANIRFSRNLERVGAQVVYGFAELKTHAKLSLVVRKESDGLRSYVHIGTGNYHPVTAKIYTDLSFFTCDPAIGRDVAAMFNYMTGYAEPKALEKLAYAPVTMRTTLMQLIDDEIRHAREGRPAAIWVKLNSLVDPDIIDKLYDASNAGVDIALTVRGVCCLRPGVPGLSDRITVRSVVGRFLEHSRILCFGNGHGLPSASAKVFITSADWMTRNLDRRIEVMTPIENPTVHQQVMGQIMIAKMIDNAQSWEMLPDGTYRRIMPGPGDELFSAHEYFMKNPSLSGRGSAVLAGSLPPELKLKDY
jgi:polyphosphate kinase